MIPASRPEERADAAAFALTGDAVTVGLPVLLGRPPTTTPPVTGTAVLLAVLLATGRAVAVTRGRGLEVRGAVVGRALGVALGVGAGVAVLGGAVA
ncbi:MAG: hypothetical protein JWN87_2058, partial [Frankiales bacterium]|nr:hypothetical protein [Frankiales bacterium]